MNPIPSSKQNPTGLHKRYLVKKMNGLQSPEAEYFVLRLDPKGNDKKHLKACRLAIAAYAGAIEKHLPDLAKDIRERYLVKMKRKAIIRKARGKNAGQFRFILVADNGEIIGGSHPETYTQKHNAIETIKEYHPSFKIVDLTNISSRVSDKKIANAI